MLVLILLLALAPTLIMAQTRVNSYAGCTIGAPGLGFPGTSLPPTSPNNVISTCGNACAAAGYTYAYFRPSDQTCLCSATSPPSYSITAAAAGSTTCANTAFTVLRLATTFPFIQCGLVAGATGLQPAFTTSSMDDCFVGCRFAPGAIISATGADTSQSEFQCRCRTQTLSYSTTRCGPGATRFFLYSHQQTAASAGLTRRGAKMRNAEEEYCPAGLTACRIRSSEDGYECIDTMSELESCGGCVFGRYGTRKRGVKGVNCATLDSYGGGGTTCKAGRCVDAFQARR